MKIPVILIIILLTAMPVIAQVEFITDNYFPAEFEFEELKNIASESHISDSTQLSDIENGSLITVEGFDTYRQRTYSVGDSGSLSIEVVTLVDFRAAYSLLSLLRSSDIQDGPPGNAFASESDSILFCHGKRWIRIRGSNVPGALIRRVATSVSNRMGPPRPKVPALIGYLPENGLEKGSLKYFPGSKPFDAYRTDASNSIIQTRYDMEIVQAGYSYKNQTGILTLLKLPTPQLSEEYFSELSSSAAFSNMESRVYAPKSRVYAPKSRVYAPKSRVYAPKSRVYAQSSGPLLCILEGDFDPALAGDILGHIQYTYSVQWIYDKDAQPAIVWGVPTIILSTTVWAIFLVIGLFISSILVGAGLAGLRLLLRRFYPNNPLDNPKRTEITRLRLP